MSQQELVMWLGTAALLTGTFVLAALYHRRLRPLVKEYWQAKVLLDNIVTTFRRRYDELSRLNSALSARVETNARLLEERAVDISRLSENLTSVSDQVGTLAKSSEAVKTDITSLHIEFEKIRDRQDTAVARELPPLGPRTALHITAPKQPSSSQMDLTDTEQAVLQFLKIEGPKTSRQIEVKIAKTREHTARLMKKLWQEGYVERETHRTPFTYRLANGFQELDAQRA